MMTNVKGQFPGLTRSSIISIKHIKGAIVEAIMHGDWTIKSINYRNPPTSSWSTSRLMSSIFETNRRYRYNRTNRRYQNRRTNKSYRSQWYLLSNNWLQMRPRNKKLRLKVDVKANPTFQAKKGSSLPDVLAHPFSKMCEESLQFWRSPNFTESNRCKITLLMSHMSPQMMIAPLAITRSYLQILFPKTWKGSRSIQFKLIHFKKLVNEEEI